MQINSGAEYAPVSSPNPAEPLPELTFAEKAVRRIVRPSSYTGVMHNVIDRPKWKRFREMVQTYADTVGDDFFLLQIGANDGTGDDPIRDQLQASNWRGLLVEPVPHYYEGLKRTYAANTRLGFANVAVNSHDGTATILASKQLPGNQHNPLQGMSSLHPDIVRKHGWLAKDPDSLVEPIEVRTLTLGSLLDTYGVARVDYLAIDTEGHDKAILDQLDFERCNPQFILYEHNNISRQDRREACEMLEGQGYEVTALKRDTLAARPF